MGLQAPEDPHDSSTDTCLTFPYSSNSPRPFPPSPVHPVTDSPLLLPLATLLVITLLSTGLLATTLLLLFHPLLLFLHLPKLSLSILPAQTTNSSNNPFYTPYFSSSFHHTGPIVFPGGPPEFPTLGSHFLGLVLLFPKLLPFLPILYFPWLLLLLNPHLSFPLGLSP